VEQTVASVEGQTLTVKHKDEEQKIAVSPETPIVAYVPGDKSDLKPGAKATSLPSLSCARDRAATEIKLRGEQGLPTRNGQARAWQRRGRSSAGKHKTAVRTAPDAPEWLDTAVPAIQSRRWRAAWTR
jgi:hypothetical protein